MRTILAAVLTVVIGCGQAWAADSLSWKWDATDKALAVAYNALLVVDWRQTQYIAAHPGQYREQKQAGAIGEHPTSKQVNRYFAQSFLINNAMSFALPSVFGLRKTWQVVLIAERLDTVLCNRSLGIGASYHF